MNSVRNALCSTAKPRLHVHRNPSVHLLSWMCELDGYRRSFLHLPCAFGPVRSGTPWTKISSEITEGCRNKMMPVQLNDVDVGVLLVSMHKMGNGP